MKTLEFKLSLSAEHQSRLDDWMLVTKWIWNRGTGLIQEFQEWNPYHKESKQHHPACPIWQYDPEIKDYKYGRPEQWKLNEPLKETSKGLIRPVRIAKEEPSIEVITWQSLLYCFAHKWHKNRQVIYLIDGTERTVAYVNCPAKFIAGIIQSLGKSWEAFLKGNGKPPKIKKHNNRIDTLINNNSKEVKIFGDYVSIPKIGKIKAKGLKKRWPQNLQFCPLKICRKASGYYLQITGDIPSRKFKNTGHVAGLDPGNQFVCSDDIGHQVEPPKYYERSLKKLAELQRRASKMWEMNKDNPEWKKKNWRKLQKEIAQLHEKIKRRRRAFNHLLSTKIVNTYDIIFIEDYNVKELGKQEKPIEIGETINKYGEKVKLYGKNGHKKKSYTIRRMRDNANGQLWQMLEKKAAAAGKVVVRVPAPYTSWECPRCHNVEYQGDFRKVRHYNCSKCGYSSHIDVSAAQIIKQRGLQQLEN